MPQVDKRKFVNSAGGAWKGGMDKDSEIRYVQDGFYRNARNVSFMVEGDRFVLTNIKGNTQKSHTLPSGDNMVIGAYDDKPNETVYYFIFNGTGNHSIVKYEYNVTVNTVTELVEGAGLNFQYLSLITGIAIVQNRFLVWADYVNEIGCLDLDNLPGINITAAERWRIELYKVPDPIPLAPKFCTILSKTTSAISNRLYKFRTRYIYQGNFRTHPSTITKLAVPEFGHLIHDQDTIPDNQIRLHIEPPDYDLVEKVELLVQSGETDDTMGAWYKFAEVDASDLPQTMVFTGEEAMEAVDPTEMAMPFSFIPKTCKDIIFLPSNVLDFLNTKEGFDAEVDPSMQVFPIYNARTDTGAATTTIAYSGVATPTAGTYINVNFDILLNTGLNYKTITIGGTPKVGDYLALEITISHTGTVPITFSNVLLDFSYVVEPNDTTATIAENISRIINTIDTRYLGFGGIIAYYPGSGSVCRLIYGQNQNQLPYTPTSDIASATVLAAQDVNFDELRSYPNFKRWAEHPWAIQYEDSKGRRSGAIPAASFYALGYDDTTNDGWVSAQAVIEHEAPADAVRYHLLYAKNQTYETFLQAYVTVDQLIGFYYSANIFDTISQDRESYGTFSQEYSFVEGDRIRFIGAIVGGTFSFFSEIISLPIIEADANNVRVFYDLSTLSPSPTFPATVLVEVWRPKSSASTRLYYEVGQSYEVYEDSGVFYHRGNNQDQTSSQGAIIDLDDVGDTYSRLTPTTTTPAPTDVERCIEGLSYSAFYKSEVTPIGRPNYVSPSALKEITRSTASTHTQPIIPNSPTNGLSIVLGTSLVEYDLRYGSIQKASLRQNKQLVVYFEDKVGQVGVFEELQKAADGDVVYQTSSLLNGINYYAYEGGIGLNPESFAQYDIVHYFFCPSNNAFCRLSIDGITEISQYGIKRWMNDNLDTKVQYLTDLQAFGTYDKRNGSYVAGMRAFIDFTIVSNAPTLILRPQTTAQYGAELLQVGDQIIVTDGTDTYIKTLTISDFDGTDFEVGYALPPAYNTVLTARKINPIETLWFNEVANGWMSFLDFTPETMTTCGIDFVSFKDGGIWLHNANSTYGRFYGTNFPAEVTIPFNMAPSVMKRFYNIEQETNTVWPSETDGDVQTIEGQTSQLYEGYYEQYQPGEWCAAFRQDTLTPNTLNPLLDGYDLRGKGIVIRVVNDSTNQTKLYSIGVMWEVSENSI